MKNINIFASILLVLCLLTGCKSSQKTLSGFSMDAPYSIKIVNHGKSSLDEASIKKYMSDCDYIFSAYSENSLLYSLNSAKKIGIAGEYEGELFDIITIGKEYSQKYSDIFDIAIRPVTKLWDFNEEKIPSDELIRENLKYIDENNIVISDNEISLINNAEIDLGAIAKGYVADKISEKMSDSELIIDVGGTIKSTVKRPIKVGIKSPDLNGLLCSIELDGEAVSTSGSYERSFMSSGKIYHHILSPQTGFPAESGLSAVSVIGKSAALCDILSTTFFILGIDKSLEIVEENHVEAVFVMNDNKVYKTKGIRNLEMISNNYTFVE